MTAPRVPMTNGDHTKAQTRLSARDQSNIHTPIDTTLLKDRINKNVQQYTSLQNVLHEKPDTPMAEEIKRRKDEDYNEAVAQKDTLASARSGKIPAQKKLVKEP